MIRSVTPRFLSCARLANSFERLLTVSCKCLTTPKGETTMNVFDRKAKRIQRDRTALLPDYKVYEYIKEEFGYRLADRVLDVKREFDILVDLGCGRGYVSKHLLKDTVKTIYQCELSEKMLLQSEVSQEVPTHRIVMDEEFLPFKDESLDIVVSSLSLHWVNDLPGCFRQVHNALKKDGVFLGCLFGGDTLFELRVSLQLAEQEKEGVSKLVDSSGLMGYYIDEIFSTHNKELMYDLKGMAENNCAWSRKNFLRRSTIERADEIYKEMYGNDKGVPATFQVIYFIGWRPHPSQPKPAQRGSGQISFKDLENLDQITQKLKDEDLDKLKSTSSDSGENSDTKEDPKKS
ncbi:arginine-hydroxylase NDUFAF5, mitochondrial-like [Ruditapes philippinarum]|uniref:arginine-hydroxylase NDUFAF5, mitochondrial-like n=1 Tax=Ruditapes philippinarum TaxID=129788 RepID=UPI00295AFD93|nr:arginine-hydroxylase NDUFAF5, mitochondrial-like [Ruditapes philippinarum]